MAKKTKQAQSKNRLSLVALEPRMVFDGAIGVTDPHLIDPDHATAFSAMAEAAAQAATLTSASSREAGRREIVFVDDSLTDLQGLLAGIGSHAQVVQIQHAKDGLSQINAALAGQGVFDAIHILAHGSDGVQNIGATRLDAAHLDVLKADLAALGASLTADGDLLLYGCDVAQSAQGQALVEKLAQLTGADVAASNNTTGQDGDWLLENASGPLEAKSLSPKDWKGALSSLTLADDALDSDGDAIINRLDFDDDNDGILDSQEMEISDTQNLAVNSGFKDLTLAAIEASIKNGTYTDDQENPVNGRYATNPKPDPFSIIVPNAADATKLGWRTTSSDGAFEIWGDGMLDNYKSADGDGQWMELSANEPSALYQYIDFKGQTLRPGATLTVYWSAKHAGREGVDTATVAFSLAEPLKQVAGQAVSRAGEVVVATMKGGAGQWGAYSGAYEVTNTGSADQQGIYIVFRAIQTASPTLGQGNLLDDIRVSLSPPVDMDTDGDGTPNRLDLDSDGDRFSDSSEAGVPLDKLNGPVGSDGVYDSLQAAVPQSGVLAIKPPTYESQALVPNVYPTDLPPVEVIGDVFYEGSDDHVGFSVTATPGQALVLQLTDAAEGDNPATTGLAAQPLQYSLDGTNWLNYTAGQIIYAATDVVLVRTAMMAENDTLSEPTEQVKLTVQSWSGATPQTAVGYSTVKDDDLPMAINNVRVTEGVDEYAQFSLTVNQGLSVSLTATSGTATLGTDTVAGMEYWSGSAWLPYTGAIDIPTDAANPEVKYELQVRFKVTDDVFSELPAGETFQLKATANVNGTSFSVTGTGTIIDPLVKQTLAITNAEVTEGLEQYQVFKVTGDSGLAVTISLKDDTALATSDYLPNSVHYSLDKGATWTPYTAGSTVNLSDAGDMLVRVEIADDSAAEPTESYKVIVGPPVAAPPLDGKVSWFYWPITTTGFSDDVPSGPIPMGYNPDTRTYVAFTERDANGLPVMASAASRSSKSPNFMGNSSDDGNGAIADNTGTYEALTFTGFIVPPANLQGQSISFRIPTTNGQYSAAWVMSTDGNLANWVDPVNASSKPLLDMDNTLGLNADGPVGAVSRNNVTTTGNLLTNVTTTRLLQDFSTTMTAGSSHAFYVMVSDPWNARFSDGNFNFQYSTNGGSSWTAVPMSWYSSGEPAGSSSNSGSTALPVTGIGTILDNDSVPSTPPVVPQVNDVLVNEGSPYAVFTVSGTEQQLVKLELTGPGTATSGTDYTNAMEYWDGSSWQPYFANAFVKIPKDADATSGEPANLLVRVAIRPDAISDNGETFTLKATNTANASDTGVGTIVDDNTGTVFATTRATTGVTPATNDAPAQPLALTSASTPVANPAQQTVADDDRPVTVDDVRVNEGSPYAVFTVGAKELQYVKLELASGTARATLDYINALEYWNGSSWARYTAGTFVQVPADGDGTANEAGNLLVRVAIKPDMLGDNGETFTLKASNTGGGSDTGVGTIVDDGTGTVFGTTPTASGVTAATASEPAQPVITPTASTPVANPAQQTVADDDRPLSINNVTVNEGSPYAVMKVGGREGQYVKLNLTEGSATSNVDYTHAMEYWDGSSWQAYLPGTFVKIPGDADSTLNEPADLLVRVKITQDDIDDSGEFFTLNATNTGGGSSVTGKCTILNDGTGSLFGAANTTGNPDVLGVTPDPSLPPELDNDRLKVSSITVNEGSPWAVFTVKGSPSSAITLALSDQTAQSAINDYGTGLQVLVGGQWVAYDPANPPSTNGAGQLLVRAPLGNQLAYEGPETFTLKANYAGAPASDPGARGTATILDDGRGDLFGTANTTGVPDAVRDPANTSADPSLPTAKDDDRPLAVNDLTVYEASGRALFHVQGATGQLVKLALASGSAMVGTDTGSTLEYFDGNAWQPYTPDSLVAIPAGGLLSVRTSVAVDTVGETPETFTLTATNVGGASVVGTATIIDGANPVPFNPNAGNVSQCYAAATIDVLLNDSGQMRRDTVLLSASPGDAGAKSLTTAYGTYVANNNGTVTFTPVAQLPDGSYFSGTASVVYYTVQTSAGDRTVPTPIHIGDGVLSESRGTSSQPVQPGMTSVSTLVAQSRLHVSQGGTNLIVNGTFQPPQGVSGTRFGMTTNKAWGSLGSMVAIPGWTSSGGGTETYTAWGDVSRWAAVMGNSAADPDTVYLGDKVPNPNGVYFGNGLLGWTYTGTRPVLNGDHIGIADPSAQAQPLSFHGSPGYGGTDNPTRGVAQGLRARQGAVDHRLRQRRIARPHDRHGHGRRHRRHHRPHRGRLAARFAQALGVFCGHHKAAQAFAEDETVDAVHGVQTLI